jgi:hypothetical protein
MSCGFPGCQSLVCLAASALLVIALLGAGCTSATVGDVKYRNGTILVPVTNTGEPGEAYVQLTVYGVRDLRQQELTWFQEPVVLRRGGNTVVVRGDLPPGSYKLYIYVVKDGERKTAVIRDIEV